MSAARRRGGRTSVIGVALAAALSIAGCSSADEEPAQAEQAAEQPSGQESDAPSEDGDAQEGAGGAGVQDADLEDVLVEQTVTVPTEPGDSVTVGVRSLRVEGDVTVLELVVTPDFASVSDSESLSLYEIWRGAASQFRPTLLDRVHLKRYKIVDAGPANEVFATDSVYTETVNGQPMRVYAVYAAPEDDIEAIDVVLADPWPAFTDVPVER